MAESVTEQLDSVRFSTLVQPPKLGVATDLSAISMRERSLTDRMCAAIACSIPGPEIA
jgi:hypothetical protein